MELWLTFQFITLLIIDLEGIIKVFNPFNILIPVIFFMLVASE